MNTGDLVKHNPASDSIVAKLYNDWNHKRDFSIGIVVEVREGPEHMFALVVPSDTNFKPGWYEYQELEVVSERR